MAAWVIRGGLYEEETLESGTISIGYSITSDLTGAQTIDDVRKLVQSDHPHANNNRIGQITGQAWSFKERIEVGDLIVMPRKGQPSIAIGEMAGEYVFLSDRPEQGHSRKVKWINTEAARSSLDQDLKSSLSADITVFQPRAQEAEKRLRAVAEGTGPYIPYDTDFSDSADDADVSVNLEEDANNRIRDYIGSHFHGHEFTRLVAEVLRGQGYAVEVAPPGPDGGVDVVAGS